MSETKLLPCPFCGGEAEIRMCKKGKGYFVLCKYCGNRTPEFKHISMTLEALEKCAIKAWNTRKPMERIVERLEERLESLSDGGDDWFTAEKINEAIEIVKAGGVDD